LAGAVIAIEPLKQFSSQRKAYFVVITYGKQVSLLQFSFHITPHRMEASQVQLAKLFSETITNVQPFSLRVLYNSSVEVTTSGTQTGQKGGKEDKCLKSIEQKQEIILGCSSGTLILYELKMQKRSIAVVGGVQMPPPQKALYQTPPESLQEHRRVALQEKEPLLYIEECLGPHQTNTVLFGTLSGTIYLLNHRSKPAQTIQKVHLSQGNQPNVLFGLVQYAMFCCNKNPFLVVHDRNYGVFVLNMVTQEKAHILDQEAKEWQLQS